MISGPPQAPHLFPPSRLNRKPTVNMAAATATAFLLKPATNFTLCSRPPHLNPRPSPSLMVSITCGPRDNRRPLVRGRTLSTEAILAVQALKRARRDASKVDHLISTSLSRLVKPDLVAALSELQRQNQWQLALKVFVALRREFCGPLNYGLYADMVSALGRIGMGGEIDVLVGDLLEEGRETGINGDDLRGLAKLLKTLIAAERGEAVKAVYKEMKRGGCVGDEYLFKVLCKGLRKLGEVDTADEVDRDYATWLDRGGRIEHVSV